MKKSITVNWKLLGAELANMSDNEQGEFFVGFAEEMLLWNTKHSQEGQCIMIGYKLNSGQKNIMRTIGFEETEVTVI